MKDDKAEKLFQIIKNDKAQENHFFETLEKTSNPFPWLRPLYERGYFDPQNNPVAEEVPDQKGYFSMPRWNILGYLENIANENAKSPRKEITELLAIIVDAIISFKGEEGLRIDNYVTDSLLIRVIFSLPINKLTEKHIEFVNQALHSTWRHVSLVTMELTNKAFPHLICNNEKDLVLKLLEVVLSYEKQEGHGLSNYDSIIDEYWLNDLLEKQKTDIGTFCAIEAADVALNTMTRILSEDKDEFHLVTIRTIEDHSQMQLRNNYEYQLVRFVRDMYEMAAPELLVEKVTELLTREFSIFKRIAIHTINYHYNTLNELFWRYGRDLLGGKWLKHELYVLIESKSLLFSKDQIKKLLSWIESAEYYIPDDIEDKGEIEKRLAFSKKEWLSALMETKDKDVMDAFEKYNVISPGVKTHPGFDYWIETRWGGFENKINRDELLSKSNVELATYLNEYEDKPDWDEPDRDDLRRVFEEIVSNYPHRFSEDLEPFLTIDSMYQSALITGLCSAWKSNKDINWEKVFFFISHIVSSEPFLKESENDKPYRYQTNIAAETAELIKEGTKDDKHAFSPDLLPVAENLLLQLINKLDEYGEPDVEPTNDFITFILNNPRGQVLSSMVSYLLRYSRLFGIEGDRWKGGIKEYFIRHLNDELQPSIQYCIILGRFLPSFFYLDKDWIISNINRIFPQDHDLSWEAAFTGYIYSTNLVYKDLYILLSENGHYVKALNIKFKDNHCLGHTVGHICVAYLEDWEKLDDPNSLISQLIQKQSVEIMSEIVQYFWRVQDEALDRIRPRIKPLWGLLHDTLFDNIDNIEYKKIISDISSRWLSLVDVIDDEVFEWIKQSVKYVEANYNSPELVENLLLHVEKTPKEVGLIYAEILENNIFPMYDKKNIEAIVNSLYDENETESADTICNLYMARGFDFIKPIYESHHSLGN